jgi:MFS family permease
VLVTGFLLFACTYAGFALATESWMVFALFFVYGMYAAATEGIAKAWVTNLAHDHETATAIGFLTSCQSICTLLASIIAGLLWDGFGAAATFGISAVAALVVALYLKWRVNFPAA